MNKHPETLSWLSSCKRLDPIYWCLWLIDDEPIEELEDFSVKGLGASNGTNRCNGKPDEEKKD